MTVSSPDVISSQISPRGRAGLRQREVFFSWTARHDRRFGLGAGTARVGAAYRRARAGLAARPVDGFGPAEFDRAVYRALGRTEHRAGLADGIRAYLRVRGRARARTAAYGGRPPGAYGGSTPSRCSPEGKPRPAPPGTTSPSTAPGSAARTLRPSC
ncbi:hypothetical protein ACWDZ4_18345 [Streptomyces sp. NPDC003016]